jgi:hypothetical protein
LSRPALGPFNRLPLSIQPRRTLVQKLLGLPSTTVSGSLRLSVLQPTNLIAGDFDVPAIFWAAFISPAHFVTLNGPLGLVVLAVHNTVRGIVLGIWTRRIHVAVDRLSRYGRFDFGPARHPRQREQRGDNQGSRYQSAVVERHRSVSIRLAGKSHNTQRKLSAACGAQGHDHVTGL